MGMMRKPVGVIPKGYSLCPNGEPRSGSTDPVFPKIQDPSPDSARSGARRFRALQSSGTPRDARPERRDTRTPGPAWSCLSPDRRAKASVLLWGRLPQGCCPAQRSALVLYVRHAEGGTALPWTAPAGSWGFLLCRTVLCTFTPVLPSLTARLSSHCCAESERRAQTVVPSLIIFYVKIVQCATENMRTGGRTGSCMAGGRIAEAAICVSRREPKRGREAGASSQGKNFVYRRSFCYAPAMDSGMKGAMVTNLRTSSGSNCVPALRLSSAIACSWVMALR